MVEIRKVLDQEVDSELIWELLKLELQEIILANNYPKKDKIKVRMIVFTIKFIENSLGINYNVPKHRDSSLSNVAGGNGTNS